MTDNEIRFQQLDQLQEEEPLLRWFSAAHLPPKLKGMMMSFDDLARTIVVHTPKSAERTVALRKLIESSNCAIRCLVDVDRAKQAGEDSIPGVGGGEG